MSKKTILFSLALCLLLLGCAKEKEINVFASGLGTVFGLAFDQEGNLFATGAYEQESVVWKISPDGKKEVFAVVKDKGDRLSDKGLATHSRHLASLAVDRKGNIWVTSLEQGACFVISGQGRVTKIYLNSAATIAAQMNLLQGVVWDHYTEKLYIITSGPEMNLTTGVEAHIRTLTVQESTESFCDELFETEGVKFIRNQGIPVQHNGNGIFKAFHSPLYFIARDGLYIVKPDGKFKKFGRKIANSVLLAGAVDEEGNIYLTSNKQLYVPGYTKHPIGIIYKINQQGKKSILLKNVIKEPLGIVFHEGALYVADRATGQILRVNLKQ